MARVGRSEHFFSFPAAAFPLAISLRRDLRQAAADLLRARLGDRAAAAHEVQQRALRSFKIKPGDFPDGVRGGVLTG